MEYRPDDDFMHTYYKMSWRRVHARIFQNVPKTTSTCCWVGRRQTAISWALDRLQPFWKPVRPAGPLVRRPRWLRSKNHASTTRCCPGWNRKGEQTFAVSHSVLILGWRCRLSLQVWLYACTCIKLRLSHQKLKIYFCFLTFACFPIQLIESDRLNILTSGTSLQTEVFSV